MHRRIVMVCLLMVFGVGGCEERLHDHGERWRVAVAGQSAWPSVRAVRSGEPW